MGSRGRRELHVGAFYGLLAGTEISLQPRESLFHGVRGDILASQGRHGDAVRSYDDAIERNPDYFGHYLGRGLSRDTLGHRRMARADLAHSNRLLPTPFASFKARWLCVGRRSARGSQTPVRGGERASGDLGTAARNAFARLDVEDAPWNYVKTEPFFEDGQVVVEVSNTSGYDVAGIVVRVHVEINGESVYRRLGLDRLATGYYDVLESGIYYREHDGVEAETLVLRAAPGW